MLERLVGPDRGRVAVLGAWALIALLVVGGSSWKAYHLGRQSVDMAQERRRVSDAEARESQAKASAKASGELAEDRLREVERLRGQLASRPTPPPAEPVAPDASAADVAAGLSGLGLRPVLLGGDPALGLNLPDGRTILGWGREVQRVPPLVARLETLEQLAQAQEGATSALHRQAADLAAALKASDEGREAERRIARRLAPDRPWAAGLLVGVDTTGTRRLGAYASRSWGPAQFQVVVMGNQAAIGGGFRF